MHFWTSPYALPAEQLCLTPALAIRLVARRPCPITGMRNRHSWGVPSHALVATILLYGVTW
eukprot:2943339-Alexandrium_andersonii.AAC.1